MDRHEGKITSIFRDVELVHGALISFYIYKRRSTVCLGKKVQVLDVPFELAKKDILFLHHVFELCSYFLFFGDKSIHVFDLLMMLYCPNLFVQPLHKKIFLFKLVEAFGYYTDSAPLSLGMFYRLSSESIDSLVNSNLHLEIERNIDEWLSSCIKTHPCFLDFKTVHFLKKIRLP